MKLQRQLRVAVIGVVASVAMGGMALAQGVPAETPPASFSGDQYVDSAGCVFVRAGVGGVTEWVPRVGRDRNQICGQRPTGGVTASAPARATPTTTTGSGSGGGAGIVIIGASPSVSAPAPTRPAVTAPAIRTVPAAPAITTVRPAPVAPSLPRTAPTSGTTCPGATGLTAQYLSGPGVRCGPQAVHPGDAARGINRPGVSLDPASFQAPVAIPEGYRAAFDDGRINPLRGLGTPQGAQQMALIWTETVPRRLVDGNSGRAVGHLFPGLRYPNTSLAPQDAVAVTVSTRSVAPAAARTPPAATLPADHRHVLAATYQTRDDADRAYARLAASGLPARLGQIDRSSGMVYAVVAGPFATPDALMRGLQGTQSAGFPNAITRR
jgi:hypothetical protein